MNPIILSGIVSVGKRVLDRVMGVGGGRPEVIGDVRKTTEMFELRSPVMKGESELSRCMREGGVRDIHDLKKLKLSFMDKLSGCNHLEYRDLIKKIDQINLMEVTYSRLPGADLYRLAAMMK